jgi:GR25 family glycosyltransferase involved in LPS biosynthesis
MKLFKDFIYNIYIMNNFNKFYYINLDHRKDRLYHIKTELSKMNIDTNKIKRISGIYYKTFGILGCAKSHCIALTNFINSCEETCVIFEDDFEFTHDQNYIDELVNKIFENNINFDVLMLSANILNNVNTEYNFINKIIDAQTLSGYAVSKKFAPILLNNFRESIYMLEKIGQKVHNYCFDIYMKKLQPLSNWFCLNPLIGKQIESYSDIENMVVKYDC